MRGTHSTNYGRKKVTSPGHKITMALRPWLYIRPFVVAWASLSRLFYTIFSARPRRVTALRPFCVSGALNPKWISYEL